MRSEVFYLYDEEQHDRSIAHIISRRSNERTWDFYRNMVSDLRNGHCIGIKLMFDGEEIDREKWPWWHKKTRYLCVSDADMRRLCFLYKDERINNRKKNQKNRSA
ncbi:MAG: hypothetical protein QXT45_03580 [Candidatus Bilamarchaeaceae archaeon]